ncbi:zinc finger and SCAN domain-containing protein 31-like isoform X6 [Bradysia coprophila]|uniref:zinc finger and SCAN domain-containing protein 31-like isoform X6 n=1 Tax=Bradysia coprophila TaxID=38358 RepID=UPI00187DB239|nr:zinc finger and SCAN domain-containing protein 31-like isoform X6 [Bradysia coprophila]
MRVLVSPGKPVPIKVPRTVESHNSKTHCNDAERIREERLLAKFVDQIEKMQQKTAQFNGAARSLFANVDREDEDNDLLRKFFDEIDRDRPYCDTSSCVDPVLEGPKNYSLDARLSQVSNNDSQSEMDFNRLTGDYAKENCKQGTCSGYEMGVGAQRNLAGPSGGLPLLNNQAEQQQLLMLELQKQLQNFTVMIQQQYRQKLGENEMRETQAQTTQESAVKEAESMRMHSENADTEIVSTNNSPPLCVLNQMNPVGGLKSTQSIDDVAVDAEQTSHLRKELQHSRQTKRVDKSEGSLRTKKQVLENVRVKRSDFAADKDPVVRGKSTTYSCKHCNKAFTYKGNLIAHSRIHSGEKPFKCEECGSSFRRKITLTVHKRIHSGEKPFECRICNVAFSQKPNLSRHLLIHTNEKPFSCDICKQSFRRKGILSDHMNIHSGNRPHKCNVCQKTFHQQPTLSKHRKVHSEEEEWPTDIQFLKEIQNFKFIQREY